MSLLPQQILPETNPIGTVGASGEVQIDHNWWLLLYNLCQEVLGVGGQPPANILPLLDSALPIDALSAQSIGQQLYPITAAEISASITPLNYSWPELWVERYGADPTGVNDSGVAFRAACSVATSKGGGIIRAYGALYLFNTWDHVSFYTSSGNLALFCLPPDTELAGGGQFFTKLRISQTARTGMYSGGAARTHIIGTRGGGGQYIHDLEFDYDGIVQASANDFCYFVRTMSGNIIIERCYGTQGPITNAIVDSSTDTANGYSPQGPTIVRSCWFQDCGPNMTGNSVNADCSYLYLTAPGSRAERNRIFNTAIAAHNCGGIEMHAAQYYAIENYLKNLWPGMYLGVEDGVTVSVGSVVEKNYVGFSNSGIELVDQHAGLKITKNYFEANAASSGGFGHPFTDIFTPLNSITGANLSGFQTGLSITDNTFDCTNYLSGTARGTTGTTSINLSALTGARISENTWIAPTTAVNIAGTSTGANLDIDINNNMLVNVSDAGSNVGYFETLGDSAAGWGAGSIYTDVFIRQNKILRNRGSTKAVQFGIVSTGGGTFTATYTNVRYEKNDAVNITDGLFVSGGAVVITGVQAPAYSSPITVDVSLGLDVIITATNGSAFTISNPTNGGAGTIPYANDQLTITVKNTSGGSLGTITWSSAYKMASWTSPATGNQRSITFAWNDGAGAWYEISRTPSDIPN